MQLRYALGLLLFLSSLVVQAEEKHVDTKKAAKPKLKTVRLGDTRNVHSFGKILLCGQPEPDDFASLKKQGFKVVITLREKGEVRWDQPALMKELGLKFHRFGFRAPDSLKDEVFDKARKVLSDAKKNPVMLHCGSANRVGAIWAAHRVLGHGLSLAAALKEAQEVGLRTPAYRDKAIDYIKRSKAKRAKPKPATSAK